jgi:hypothetical protein
MGVAVCRCLLRVDICYEPMVLRAGRVASDKSRTEIGNEAARSEQDLSETATIRQDVLQDLLKELPRHIPAFNVCMAALPVCRHLPEN